MGYKGQAMFIPVAGLAEELAEESDDEKDFSHIFIFVDCFLWTGTGSWQRFWAWINSAMWRF
jgi:hypothetical protein